MWCIQAIDSEYRKRMYDVLDLYANRSRSAHVIAIDEKLKQIVSDRRKTIPMKPASPERYDYEYTRHGKANIFIAVEPKKGKRIVKVTERRTKRDFALFVKEVLKEYPEAGKICVVLDNLNTHFPGSFEEAFGREERERIMSRVEFHYTPKHASWLNIAEIEINVMDIECPGRRFENRESLEKETVLWAAKRNAQRKRIEWGFNRKQADRKLSKYYAT